MGRNLRPLILILLVVLAGCSLYRLAQFNSKYGSVRTVNRQVEALIPGQVSYHDDVQPILEQRCDVCHSCYDAPCQLKLTSFDGLERGGSKKLVYDAARLTPDQPTRLFVDADSVEGWRALDFHPVLNERNQTPEANLENSVLNLMLELKRENPLPESDLLPETFDLRLSRDYICTTAEDFSDYKSKYPLWGMPYALPGLSDAQRETIVGWLKEGALITPRPGMSPQAATIVAKWERFLNGGSIKEKLVSRYLYEHLFLGHIHFESLPDREFYRLVRSETPSGVPIVEINSLRPYDDPGVEQFYYRFRRIESTIVLKNHTVYHMTNQKMDRYRELFFGDDYTVSQLPSYDVSTTANPFKTFADIPAKSRYRFMLDDARFFVEGFMKGPVCRGQIALNVINDQFWIAFVDPGIDDPGTDTAFLAEVSDFLRIPSEKENSLRILSIWREYCDLQKQYLDAVKQRLSVLPPEERGAELSLIWDGRGRNRNALLTIFRHFDSASVVNGLVGKIPKTGWVIDYPLFERIHYLLVVGFDVFGNVGHQASTRIFMDYLRMEGEIGFLSFLPTEDRETLWKEWYRDARDESVNFLTEQFGALEWPTRINYRTDDPKREFFEKLIHHVGAATQQHDILNRCPEQDCVDENAGPREQLADREMRRLGELRGDGVQSVADVTFIHVLTGGGEKDLAYTVIRNKALSSNSLMLRENRFRVFEDDTLTVVKGYAGSYPNAFYRIPLEKMTAAIEDYLQIKDKIAYYHYAKKHSVQRNSPEFWSEADWHYRKSLEDRPVEGGLFDMYRFHRIGEEADAEIKW